MSQTNLWSISVTEPTLGSPIKRTNPKATAIGIGNDLIAAASGARRGLTLATYNDAVAASGSVTVVGASGTVGATINGQTNNVTATHNDDNATATAIGAALNANATIAALVTASVSGAVVTLTAVTAGSGGNSITLTDDTAAGVTRSGSTLSGGSDVGPVAATGTFTVSGAIGQIVLKVGGTNAAHTISLAATDNDDTATAAAVVAVIQAQTGASVKHIVTPTAVAAVAATGTINIPSNGSGNVGANIGGTGAVTVAFTTDAATTAGLLATALNTTLALEGLVVASHTAGSNVVNLTASTKGTAGNAITLVASGTGVVVSGSVLAGGVDAAVALTATTPGYGGNAISLAAVGTGMSASGSKLSGGLATAETFQF